MGLKITDKRYYNEFNSLITDWLAHNIGEKIAFEIDINVETSAKIWTDNQLTYAPDAYITLDYIQAEVDIFKDFNVGDTIRVVDVDQAGNNGDYEITEKPNSRTLRLNDTFANAVSANAKLFVVDVVDKIKFKRNFIENADPTSFISKVDGNLQECEVFGLDASDTSTVHTFIFNGQESWQIGSLTVVGLGISTTNTYESKFKIAGVIYLTPFFLYDQWEDLQDDIAPSYFFNFNCLKFVYQIEASYEGRSPFINQPFTEQYTLGDSGWFDEKMNNTPTNFYIESFLIENGADEIDAIQLSTDEQDLTIVVKNTVDAPFSASSKFTLNFCIAPEFKEEYQNNGQTLDYNFRFDRKLQTVGAASANGDQFGDTERQVLKAISASLTSSSEIEITAKIAMLQELVDYLKTLANPRYVVWVSVSEDISEDTGAVTNPTFTGSSTGWTITGAAGWAYVANNVAVAAAGTNKRIGQDATGLVIGRYYRLKYTISGYGGGDLLVAVFGATIVSGATSDGVHYTDYVLYTGADASFALQTSGVSSTYTLDDVYIEEISVDDINRAALKMQATDFYQPLADYDALITEVSQGFIEHPYNTSAGKISNVKAFVGDEIVAYSRIKVDLSESDFDVSIKKIRCGVRVKNSFTSEEFDVDEQIADFAGATVTNSLEFIDLESPRVFKAPVTELIKNFKVERDIAADAGNNRFYDIYFPFLARWEYWELNTGVNAAFFDSAEEHNGLNQKWDRFDDVANWDLYTFVEVTVEIEGVEETITFEDLFELFDYEAGTFWSVPTVTTFKDGNQLINGGDEYIVTDADTLVKAEWTWTGVGARPALAEVVVELFLNTFEAGGVATRTRISSARAGGSEMQWKSTDTSDKVVVTTVAADKIHAEAYIDYTKLQKNSTFTIEARIYDLRDLQS